MLRKILTVLSGLFFLSIMIYFAMILADMASGIGSSKGNFANLIKNDASINSENQNNKEIATIKIGYKTVNAELAATQKSREKGLMGREYLSDETGMLFVYPTEGKHGIWMKNMLIPIDILWLDSNQNIVHIEQEVEACKNTNCPTYKPSKNSKYVLEVASGWVERYGVVVGDKAVLSF